MMHSGVFRPLILSTLSLFLLCTAFVQAQTNQLPNLTNQSPSARFTLTDRVWAANPGEASICLWADDKLAAINVSIDDNSADNISWWLTQSAAYGFPVTWFIVTENVGKSLNGGTWAIWNNVQALGHEVQSHTMNHLNTNSATWVDIDTEYWGSQLAIETNMPGHKCDFLAYAGGANQYLNNRTNAAKYYAANRGGSGSISAANKIDYFATGTMSSYNLSTPNNFSYLPNLLTNTYANCYRGLACQLWHWISPTNYVSVQPFFDFIDANRADLWVGRFSDIAKYGQERDTATLTTNENSSTRIALTLTDQMLDSRFNNPLTLKVRLPAAWSNVQASQNGQPIASRVIAYNGGNYALVQAVPDQGEIALTTSAADFTASPASGWAPLPVLFTDTSSGLITNRFWDFGDGETSNTTATSVAHTYTTGGVYTVQLIASGPDGASTNTQVDCIRATTPIVPFANFIAAPTNGLAPLPVFFTETSTGSITNRFWDFGDGTTTNTTATSVTHTYASAGTNTVKLIVSGPAGESTNAQINCIKATGIVALSAGFTAAPTNGSAPLFVSFSDTSAGNITNRLWDFGDGATTNTTATSVTHTYIVAGTNTVQLIVSGPAGSSTNTQNAAVTVTVPSPPTANFSASPVSGTAPLNVTFTDTSTGSITNRFWNFGDGATTNTTATSVSHIYSASGTNTVQLVVSGPAGASTNTQANLISVATAVSTGNLIVYDSFSDAVQTNWALPSSVPSTWSTTSSIPNIATPAQNHSKITEGSLSYPGLQASAGNSWTTHQGSDDYYKDVSGVRGLVAGDAVYYSFLLKVNPSDAVSQYYMRLYNTTNIFSSGLAFGVGLSADLTKIGFSLSSRNGNFSSVESSSVAHTGVDYNSSNTFLVVLGYLRGTTAANSSMNLWINPDSATFGTATPPAPVLTLVGYNYAQEAIWNKLEYNFNGSGTGTAAGETIDELRIALDWASVVPSAISAPSGDTDSDGIPDEWEAQYFSGPTNANPNAMAANGINTINETYIAGLNPTNPASVLLISDFRSLTSASILQWQSASGRVYSVYWATNLLAGFQPLVTNLVWPQNSWTDAVHGAEATGFYRIKVQLAP